jgi:hypothetical protein
VGAPDPQQGVLVHLDRGPKEMLFNPMMAEGTWREVLEK